MVDCHGNVMTCCHLQRFCVKTCFLGSAVVLQHSRERVNSATPQPTRSFSEWICPPFGSRTQTHWVCPLECHGCSWVPTKFLLFQSALVRMLGMHYQKVRETLVMSDSEKNRLPNWFLAQELVQQRSDDVTLSRHLWAPIMCKWLETQLLDCLRSPRSPCGGTPCKLLIGSQPCIVTEMCWLFFEFEQFDVQELFRQQVLHQLWPFDQPHLLALRGSLLCHGSFDMFWPGICGGSVMKHVETWKNSQVQPASDLFFPTSTNMSGCVHVVQLSQGDLLFEQGCFGRSDWR